jgi:acetone carboxylase gamma subunit
MLTRPVGEYLAEVPEDTGWVIVCRKCNHRFCSASDDPREFAVRRKRELRSAGPLYAKVSRFVFLESYCPECGLLFDVEIMRRDAAV